jgi:hypothetical protein
LSTLRLTKRRQNNYWVDHDIIPSSIIHKLNVSGHILTWAVFLILVCGTHV